MTDIDQAAKTLWNYMQMHQTPQKCDAIFLLGNRDDRTAVRAAELFNEGYANWLIISGGSARLDYGGITEAERFARIAEARGVPRRRMILEERAANTGQNITFVYELLREQGHDFTSFLLVQKPYMERRAFATFKKQWPNPGATIIVTSPQIDFEEYVDYNDLNDKETIINVMVGDLQRIIEYPKQGLQIPQDIPDDVMNAWQTLVDAGYKKRLM